MGFDFTPSNTVASLLHSRFLCRHATLLPGALRDDTKNGCVAPPGPSHGSATSTVVQKVDRSILWINSTQSQFFRHWRWRVSSSTGWLQHLAQHIWRNCVAKKRDSTQYWFVSKQKRLLKIWYPRLWRHCNPCWWHEAVDERPQCDVVQTAGITPAFN